MIDYEKKYNEYTFTWNLIQDVSQEYPDCNGFEKSVISMRKQGWTYGDIQSKLGMPSKKQIRQVLVKWAPELIDNSVKKVITCSEYEAELYNIVNHANTREFEIFGDKWELFIEDNKLKYIDDWEDTGSFSDLDIATQSQILNEVKKNELSKRV